jgi:hypothetical protein
MNTLDEFIMFCKLLALGFDLGLKPTVIKDLLLQNYHQVDSLLPNLVNRILQKAEHDRL